jgi:hypothetical protein
MIEILIALIMTQKIMQSERRRESMELRYAESFPSFAVANQKTVATTSSRWFIES